EAFDQPILTTSGDEFSELARGANRMAEKLARLAAERERAQWVGTGLVRLAEALSGELDEHEVAARATEQLASYGGALAAALYRRDSDDILRLLGEHAGADLAQSFRVGEGLVGQAGGGREIVVIEEVPPGFFR